MAGLGTSVASDTPVKNAIADFRHGAFRDRLLPFARSNGNRDWRTKIAATCKAILKEEKAMAKTLEGLFPAVNAAYLCLPSKMKRAPTRGLESKSRSQPARKKPATRKSAK